MDTTKDLSLREKKYAHTKLALLRTAIKMIQEKPLSAISVRELCETVSVSEMTFYNYFPQKTDVLVYYIQVTILEAVWYLQHAVKNKTYLEMVEECFDFLARKLAADPLVMPETLAYFGQERTPPEFPALSQAERILAFPDLPGIEQLSVEDTRIETVITPYLEQAIQSAELPDTLELDTVVLMSASIFTGLVMNLHLTRPDLLRPLCRRQLRLLWKALRAEAEEKKNNENS
jgi:AcrR family transcriptional regulator